MRRNLLTLPVLWQDGSSDRGGGNDEVGALGIIFLALVVQIIVVLSRSCHLSRPSWFRLFVMYRLIKYPWCVYASEIILLGLTVDVLRSSAFGTHSLEFSATCCLFSPRRHWFIKTRLLRHTLDVFCVSVAINLMNSLLKVPLRLIPCGEVFVSGLIDGTVWMLFSVLITGIERFG